MLHLPHTSFHADVPFFLSIGINTVVFYSSQVRSC